MNQYQMIERIYKLIQDLGFDYDRMSQSGQQAYDEICELFNKMIGG